MNMHVWTPCLCPTCGQPVGNSRIEDVITERRLTRSEATILRAIANANGRAVPVDRLVYLLWGDDPSGGPDTAVQSVTVFISRLRKAIIGTGIEITNARGVGYRIEKAKESA